MDSSIKYVTNKEAVTNQVFVANQVFIGNHVFVWKISWQYFGSGQSSICLKDQLTILWLSPIKYLPEISIDNTSAQTSWSDHSKKVFLFKKYFLEKKYFFDFFYQLIRSAADQPDQLISKSARSDQLIGSNQQVISDQSFYLCQLF